MLDLHRQFGDQEELLLLRVVVQQGYEGLPDGRLFMAAAPVLYLLDAGCTCLWRGRTLGEDAANALSSQEQYYPRKIGVAEGRVVDMVVWNER